jgi:hypothetical protein
MLRGSGDDALGVVVRLSFRVTHAREKYEHDLDHVVADSADEPERGF